MKYPGLYNSADGASNEKQATFLHLIRAEYILSRLALSNVCFQSRLHCLEDRCRQQQDEADPHYQQAWPVLRQAKEAEPAPTRLKCRAWGCEIWRWAIRPSMRRRRIAQAPAP